jgi:hypothetical protein
MIRPHLILLVGADVSPRTRAGESGACKRPRQRLPDAWERAARRVASCMTTSTDPAPPWSRERPGSLAKRGGTEETRSAGQRGNWGRPRWSADRRQRIPKPRAEVRFLPGARGGIGEDSWTHQVLSDSSILRECPTRYGRPLPRQDCACSNTTGSVCFERLNPKPMISIRQGWPSKRCPVPRSTQRPRTASPSRLREAPASPTPPGPAPMGDVVPDRAGRSRGRVLHQDAPRDRRRRCRSGHARRVR